MKFLIVNADDFGLVPSVSEGILEAHARGIVSSATAFANRKISAELIHKAKACGRLGIGIHLNITLGEPLSRTNEIRSLVDKCGLFHKKKFSELDRIKPAELEKEWLAQIARFRKIWGRLPTHLDSHHHVHTHTKIWKIFKALARKFRLPFRMPHSAYALLPDFLAIEQNILLPEILIGDMNPRRHWTRKKLAQIFRRIRPGIYELMCHPGRNSEELAKVSSFTVGREKELRALTAKSIIRLVKTKNIQLIHFGDLKLS